MRLSFQIEFDLVEPPKFADAFSYRVGPVVDKLSTPPKHMDVIVTTKQKAQVGIIATSKGQPYTLTSKPTWTVIAGTASLQVADDGLSAWIVPPDSEGDSLIEIRDTTPGSTLVDHVKFHADNTSTPPVTTFADSFGLKILQTVDK